MPLYSSDTDSEDTGPVQDDSKAERVQPLLHRIPTRVLGIAKERVDKFLDSVGIPLAHRIGWTQHEMFDRLKVHPGNSRWPNLIINRYRTTSSVLFQGPPAISATADVAFRNWLGGVPIAPAINRTPIKRKYEDFEPPPPPPPILPRAPHPPRSVLSLSSYLWSLSRKIKNKLLHALRGNTVNLPGATEDQAHRSQQPTRPVLPRKAKSNKALSRRAAQKLKDKSPTSEEIAAEAAVLAAEAVQEFSQGFSSEVDQPSPLTPQRNNDLQQSSIFGFNGQGVANLITPLPFLNSPPSRPNQVEPIQIEGPYTHAQSFDPGEAFSPIFQVEEPPPGPVESVLFPFDCDSLPFSSSQQLDELLLQLHRDAKQLKRLPPSNHWKQAMLNHWKSSLQILAQEIEGLVEEDSDKSLTRVALKIIEAPSKFLGPLLSDPTQTSFSFQKGAKTLDQRDKDSIDQALREILKGNQGKAFNLLNSNGLAPSTAQTGDILQSLHRPRVKDLILPQNSKLSIQVQLKDFRKFILGKCRPQDTSADVFGWSPDLIFPVKAIKSKQGCPSFFEVATKFLHKITTWQETPQKPAPLICGYILTTGSLFALHKDDFETQEARRQEFKDPNLRAINKGGMWSKWAIQIACNSEAGKQAKSTLSPFQLAIGVPNGTVALTHILRSAYKGDRMIGSLDFQNCFLDMERQAVFDGIASKFPEASTFTKIMYGSNSMSVFDLQDGSSRVIRSQQGARIGCPLGSLACGIVLDPIFRELHTAFPRLDIRAITDDVSVIPPCPDNPTDEDWQQAYEDYASFLKLFIETSKRLANLNLNLKKCNLLIPNAAPAPTAEVQFLYPQGFTFTRVGVKIAGAFIGTDNYIKDSLNNLIASIKVKLERIVKLGIQNAQGALKLLTFSASNLLNYTLQVTPPILTLDHSRIFDKLISDTFLKILTPHYLPQPPSCSEIRLNRAIQRISLPFKLQGAGVTSAVRLAAVAWWSSLAKCRTEPLLLEISHHLSCYTEFAFQEIGRVLGVEQATNSIANGTFLPLDHSQILSGFYDEPHRAFIVKKLQAKLSILATNLAHKDYLKAFDASKVGDLQGILTESDFIASGASRSSSSLLFVADIAKPWNRLDNMDFISAVRARFMLPQMPVTGVAIEADGFDYSVERCQSEICTNRPFRQLLDLHGDHQQNCNPSKAAGHKAHDRMKHILARSAREAGMEVLVEPTTVKVLQGEFSGELCSKLYPTKSSTAYKLVFDQFLQAHDNLACATSHEQASIAQQSIVQSSQALLQFPAQDASATNLDLLIKNNMTNEEIWVDVTFIHTTAPSYRPQEIKSLLTKQTSKNLSLIDLQQGSLPDLASSEISPAILTRRQDKIKRYSNLLAIATRQAKTGKRSSFPRLTPFVLSDLGESNLEVDSLIDYLAFTFKRKMQVEGPRDDGLSPTELARKFKSNLRAEIQVVTAKRVAQMIRAGGLPFVSNVGRMG